MTPTLLRDGNTHESLSKECTENLRNRKFIQVFLEVSGLKDNMSALKVKQKLFVQLIQ